MRTFKEYEEIALESKKILFDAYIKRQQIIDEYQKKGGIAAIEAYKWKNYEMDKIDLEFKNNAHRSLFIESWNVGNFTNCDYHYERFFI